MHNIDTDELDNLICCYVEDLLEREGYKQRWQDADQINGHARDMIRHIEMSTLGLLQRLRSAHPTDDNHGS
jgi:hypothetical protein